MKPWVIDLFNCNRYDTLYHDLTAEDPVIGKHAEFVLSGIAPAPK
jgi:hypothetical protein